MEYNDKELREVKLGRLADDLTNPDDHTALRCMQEYALMLEREHRDLSDEKLLESPNGPFLGAGRNQRWMDEISRRSL